MQQQWWSSQIRFNVHPPVPADGCSPLLPAWATGPRGLRLSPWPPLGSAPWSPAWSAGSSSCRNSLQRCNTNFTLVSFFSFSFYLWMFDVFNTATFAYSPGVLVTFLPAGPQLEEIILLQTEQAVSVDVDYLKDVRQHLPVARMENYSRMSARQ